MTPGRWILGICLGLTILGFPPRMVAQEKTEKKDDKQTKNDEVWLIRRLGGAAAAAQLLSQANLYSACVVRLEYARELLWDESLAPETAPPLDSKDLDLVVDGTPMPAKPNERGPDLRKDQKAIIAVWNQAILQSFRTPLDAFKNSAKENENVTFAQLYNQPDLYRGKVIPVGGRMKRLRRWEAPWAVKKEGLPVVYEGWIYTATRDATPYWVIFTVLPEGLKEAEDMDRQVTFYGYFLKKVKYRAVKGDFDTPLLVGPTVELKSSKKVVPPDTKEPFPMQVLGWAVGLVGVVSLFLVLLTLWFRRGDQALQQKLANMQADRAREMLEDAEPGVEEAAQPKIADLPNGTTPPAPPSHGGE